MKNQIIQKEKIIDYSKIFILILSILPFVLISFYSRPCADDFGYSLQTYRLVQGNNWNVFSLIGEAWKTNVGYYNNWQGLYVSGFLLALQPGIFGEKIYFIGSILLMLLIYFSLNFFVKTIFNHFKKDKDATFYSLLLTSFILNGLPSTVQGLYWFNGAWNYMPFFFLTILNISLIIRFFDSQKKACIIFASIISFLISGGNHVTAFLNILVLVAGIFLFADSKAKKIMLFPLGFALAGFLVNIFSPGTATRMGAFQQSGVIKTMFRSLFECYSRIDDWSNLMLLILLILLVPLAFDFSKEIKDKLKFHPLIMILSSGVIECGIMCVPYYAMGGFGAGRVTNIFWMTLCLLISIDWIYSIIWLKQRNDFSIPSFKNAKIIVLVLVAFMCFHRYSNSLSIAREMADGTAESFAESYDERLRIMSGNEMNGAVKFAPLPESKNLKFSDITADENDWLNQCWTDYYNCPAVINDEE